MGHGLHGPVVHGVEDDTALRVLPADDGCCPVNECWDFLRQVHGPVLAAPDLLGEAVGVHNEETWVTTGLDCSSDFTVFPRYGYVSDYTADTAQAQAEIQALSDRYHINAYQLYDWMWRHETLIQRSGTEAADSWQDLFGRTISVQTIRDYISAIHSRNGAAMAYVMSYAAREGYTDKGIDPSAGLFTDQGHDSQLNVDFGDDSTYLWLFDPANEVWQQTIKNHRPDWRQDGEFLFYRSSRK